MPKSRKRIVVCLGAYCNDSRRAKPLFERLQRHVDAANGDAYPPPFKLETANCLSLCGAGPNVVVYPDDAMFHHVDLTLCDAIAAEHLTLDEDAV